MPDHTLFPLIDVIASIPPAVLAPVFDAASEDSGVPSLQDIATYLGEHKTWAGWQLSGQLPGAGWKLWGQTGGITSQFGAIAEALTEEKASTASKTATSQIVLDLFGDPRITDVFDDREKRANFAGTLVLALRTESKAVTQEDAIQLVQALSATLKAVRESESFQVVQQTLDSSIKAPTERIAVLEEERQKVYDAQRYKVSKWMWSDAGDAEKEKQTQEIDKKINYQKRIIEKAQRGAIAQLTGELPKEIAKQELTGKGDLAKSVELLLTLPFEALLGQEESKLLTALVGKSVSPAKSDKEATIAKIKKLGMDVIHPGVPMRTEPPDNKPRLDLQANFREGVKRDVQEKGAQIIRDKEQTILWWAWFNDLPLNGLKFDSAHVEGFHFVDCKMDGVSFKDAVLKTCDFKGTEFTGSVDFSDAIIDRATFESMLPALKQAKANGISVNFKGALIEGNLAGLDLRGIDIEGAKLLTVDSSINVKGTTVDPESLKTFEGSLNRASEQGALVGTVEVKKPSVYRSEVLDRRVTYSVMAQIDATAKWHGELTPEVRKAIEEKVYDSIKSKSPEDKQAWREVLAGSPDKVLEFIEAPLDPSQNPPVELGADFVKGCLDKFEQEEIFKDKQEEVKEKAAAAVVAGPVTDTPAKSTEGGALHDLSKVFSEAPKLAKPVMQFLIGDTTKPPTKMGGLLVKLAERYLFSKEAMQEMGLKQGLQVKTVGECFSFVATVGIAKLPTVIGLIKRVASIGQATATVEGLKGIVTAKTLGNASGVLKTFLAQGEAQQEKIKKKGTWVERDAERKQGGESPPAASIPCR